MITQEELMRMTKHDLVRLIQRQEDEIKFLHDKLAYGCVDLSSVLRALFKIRHNMEIPK